MSPVHAGAFYLLLLSELFGHLVLLLQDPLQDFNPF